MKKSRFAHRADAGIHQAGRGSHGRVGFRPSEVLLSHRQLLTLARQVRRYGSRGSQASKGLETENNRLKRLLVNAQQKYQWLANALRDPTFKNGIQTPFPGRAPYSHFVKHKSSETGQTLRPRNHCTYPCDASETRRSIARLSQKLHLRRSPQMQAQDKAKKR